MAGGDMQRAKIHIRGIVQGVGFRPYVYRLARSLGLNGYVQNTSDGVIIDVEGEDIKDFLRRLPENAPPLSKISDMDVTPLPPQGYTEFRILQSGDTYGFTLISPDISICDDCLHELFDPQDRRYLYPFINCTNCGPRYTIIKSVPYDRPNTTMNIFTMCDACLSEYNDPQDRRFHAQPNACHECGPDITLFFQDTGFKKARDALEFTITLLRNGHIIAIKGMGGFNLVCNAMNEKSVMRLRDLKRKNNKPFALMAPDIESIRRFCYVDEGEERLLLSKERPIVLLRKKEDCVIPDAVAPNNRYLGFMLPYTPLHYMLFFHPDGLYKDPNFSALVMTSGNISEEPIVINNDEAILKFGNLADFILLYNRDIFMRVDDSVLFHNRELSNPVFIRRSRGYSPLTLRFSETGPEVLAVGGEMKNVFTITKEDHAIISQHIGDMQNFETLLFFEETLENLKSVYKIEPSIIACDMHPDYLSTRWAELQKLELHKVQHHHAHIASVMAENNLRKEVIGVAFDGTGYGTDGNIWGGEFLIVKPSEFKRIGHLRYIPLPGSEAAIKEPWRIAIALIQDVSGDEVWRYLETIGFIDRYGEDYISMILRILKKRELSPMSSGAGRLFDAVAAITGICDRNTFEAESAMALESVLDESVTDDYPVDIVFRDTIEIDLSPAILRILDDMFYRIPPSTISTRFHNTFITIIIRTVMKISMLTDIRDVVLSGGVFQNRYILERVFRNLIDNGMNVYLNRYLPPNDACISLGQAYVVRERLRG